MIVGKSLATLPRGISLPRGSVAANVRGNGRGLALNSSVGAAEECSEDSLSERLAVRRFALLWNLANGMNEFRHESQAFGQPFCRIRKPRREQRPPVRPTLGRHGQRGASPGREASRHIAMAPGRRVGIQLTKSVCGTNGAPFSLTTGTFACAAGYPQPAGWP